MPKTGAQRAAAYAAKIDPDVMRSRIAARRTDMIEAQQSEQTNLANLYLQIRSILRNAGISSIFNALYNGFAGQCYGLQKKFEYGTTTLATEIGIAKASWTTRGLVADVLHEIGTLFGVSV